MKPIRGIAAAFLLVPFWSNAQSTPSNAQPIPSEVQSRKWTEYQTPDYTTSNSDKFVNYTRNGKVVFRSIERTVTITWTNQPDSTVILHLIEFVADTHAFASVGLDKASAFSLELTAGTAIHFSSNQIPPGVHTASSPEAGSPGVNTERRYFQVCVPKYDYFEHFEVSGTDVKLIPDTDESYAFAKRAFMKLTEIGHLSESEESKPR